MQDYTEYTEVNTNLRHYGNMRFAQLTIFFALTGALINFFFSNQQTLKPIIKYAVEVGGILLAVLFWIMEESATKKWIGFKKRAVEIEKELNYSQLTKQPISGFFSATNATRIIFIAIILFWFIVIYSYQNCLSF